MKKILKTLSIVSMAVILTSCVPASTTTDSNITSETSETSTPSKGEGWHKVDKLSFVAQDVKPTYSPAKGTLDVLVIPIELNTKGFSSYEIYQDDTLRQMDLEFFGTREQSAGGWNSMKSYYETASFDQLKIKGMVTDLYRETSPNLTMKAVQDDRSTTKLYKVYENAVNWALNHHKDVDWTEYDKNNDGCFDAIHFITNAGEKLPWNSPLWPHMAYTGMQGTHTHPAANVYSNSCLGQFYDARSQIHEQGHMLGLEDYYDYTSPGQADYIGGCDMQDINAFDWNSYSKMAVGWVKPYVIDGSADVATVTMGAASLTGDCLLIPADYTTWNGSAYDEYFLIELFSPFNNNEVDWNRYEQNPNYGRKLGEYGVRMYHVDSRLWACENDHKVDSGKELSNLNDIKQAQLEDLAIDIGPNNSKDGTIYAAPCPSKWLDYKLLTIIQAGKQDTFGKDVNSLLSKNDLFHEGDTFKFKDYSHFLSKSMMSVDTMDNGEVFPYEISFTKMSKREVTIEVKKVL